MPASFLFKLVSALWLAGDQYVVLLKVVTSQGMGLKLRVGQGEVEALKASRYPEFSTAECKSSASTEPPWRERILATVFRGS